MNERCDRCHHSPASHEDWGKGRCEARTSDNWPCTCKQYVQPSPWAKDATPEQIEQALRSLPGGVR